TSGPSSTHTSARRSWGTHTVTIPLHRPPSTVVGGEGVVNAAVTPSDTLGSEECGRGTARSIWGTYGRRLGGPLRRRPPAAREDDDPARAPTSGRRPSSSTWSPVGDPGRRPLHHDRHEGSRGLNRMDRSNR